jgi:integrase
MIFHGGNLYQSESGHFYGRFTILGSRTKRALQSITVRAAREEIQRKASEHRRAKLGLCRDPFERPVTVAELARQWREIGCPDRRRQAREGKALSETLRQLTNLDRIVGTLSPAQVTVAVCDRYHDARLREIAHQATHRGPGHRTIELELCTLSNLLQWAARAGHTPYNPIAQGRPVYRQNVKHCWETMPASDEELHTLATFLLEDDRSQPCGWQLLLEALTGCRTSEILRLRWDAIKLGHLGQPGHIDDRCLYVQRSKRGIDPYILLDVLPGHSPLRDCLTALRAWHDDRCPRSPWFLPGRDPRHPLDAGSLGHALDHAAQTLGLPHRTSHGLRAFHVRALRSLGVDDSEIAKRLGQRSGVALVETTYGWSEPGWFGGRKCDFVPDGQPAAWAPWLVTRADNLVELKNAR